MRNYSAAINLPPTCVTPMDEPINHGRSAKNVML
jgi:hypothetical protein